MFIQARDKAAQGRSARALRTLQKCVQKHGMFSKVRNAHLARNAHLVLLCSHHKSEAELLFSHGASAIATETALL